MNSQGVACVVTRISLVVLVCPLLVSFYPLVSLVWRFVGRLVVLAVLSVGVFVFPEPLPWPWHQTPTLNLYLPVPNLNLYFPAPVPNLYVLAPALNLFLPALVLNLCLAALSFTVNVCYSYNVWGNILQENCQEINTKTFSWTLKVCH